MKIAITTAELDMRKKRIDAMHAFQATERMPMMCYVDIFQYLRMRSVECEDYMESPALHLDCQMGFQKMLLEDFATDQYSVNPCIDFFVVHSAQAFGCQMKFHRGSLPSVEPWIKSERDLIALDKLDVRSNGLFLREKEFRRYAVEHSGEYPVELADGNVLYPLERLKTPGFGSSGIFSLAQMLMGMEELFVACMERPGFVHRLLDLLTEKFLGHWDDIAKESGIPSPGSIYLTDDTAVYLSPQLFEEFCIPYMKRVRNFYRGSKAVFHLCDTTMPHLEAFAREIPIDAFVGFKPCKHKTVFDSFAPVNQKFGGRIWLEPDTDPCLIHTSTLQQVYDEVWDILDAFQGSRGVMISFSTWSAEKSHAGMQACEDYANQIRREVEDEKIRVQAG